MESKSQYCFKHFGRYIVSSNQYKKAIEAWRAKDECEVDTPPLGREELRGIINGLVSYEWKEIA